MSQSIASTRSIREQRIKSLLSRLPKGKKSSYRRELQFKLADDHDIVITTSQLASFFGSGYSTIADTILSSLESMIEQWESQEARFQARLNELIESAES